MIAAQAIGKAGGFEILDPQLSRPTTHMPVVAVRKGIWVRARGHDEAEVAAFVQLLGFVDDAPLVRSWLGCVAPIASQARILAGLVMPLIRLLNTGCGEGSRTGLAPCR